MENTHLPFLTSLGGKSAGEALSGAKAHGKQDSVQSDSDGAEGKGFFSFLEGLLTQKNKTDAQAGAFAGLAFGGQTDQGAEFRGEENAQFGPGLSGDALSSGIFSKGVEAGAAAIAATENKIGKVGLASVSDAGVGADFAINVGVKAGAAGLPQANGQPGAESGIQAGIQMGDQPGLPGNMAASADPGVEGGRGLKELLIDSVEGEGDAPNLLKATLQSMKPAHMTATMAANANLGAGDVSSVEMFNHALSADGDALSERMETSRLETVGTTDKSSHLSPVRDQIMAAVAARQSNGKLEVRLDPPELGRVMISFERDGADIVRAVISADTPDTLDLLRRHADVFQRALEDQGFENLDLAFNQGAAGDNARGDADENVTNMRLGEAFDTGDAVENSMAQSALQAASGRFDRRM